MINKILVPLDGSHAAENALGHALALAGVFDSEITLFRVIEPQNDFGFSDSLAWRVREAEATAYLDALAKRIDLPTVYTEVSEGNPAAEITRFAAGHGADVVVMATSGDSGQRDGAGGTAHQVVASTGVSVLLMRTHPDDQSDIGAVRYRRILAPLDCSARSNWALQVGSAVAGAHDAELVLTHVVKGLEMVDSSPRAARHSKLISELATVAREEAGYRLEHEVARLANAGIRAITQIEVDSHIAGALDRIVKQHDIDLVIVSARGNARSNRRRYGGVSSALLSYSDAPVLVLQDRAPGERRSTRWGRHKERSAHR